MAYSESPFSSTSSSYTHRWNYDVFLSFRGEDTCNNFIDPLYIALIQAGIHTFRDDNKLPRGEEISPQLLRAIEGSRISVVVFSRNYASSRWCLDELVKIIECRQKTHQVVLPIFYDTDPSDVRKQTGSYAKAFDEHEKHFKEEMEKVNRWREALTQAANLSGRVLLNETNRYEAAFIKRVVNDVASKLGNKTRIEMTRLKSGWTDAISASEQEQNNVNMAQQREPLLTGEFERANDLTGAGIELPPDTPDDQDEFKKLKGSKSRDMVDDFESGLTGAVSASAREQNNVDKAQQREPLLTGEFERANDLTGAGIELPPDTPDDQDELKKLKGSKSRDMVDDFKSGLTGAVSASAREQNNVDKAQQREPLFTGEFERANDLTGARIELLPDSSDDQEPLFLALDSVHHVDRIIPPTIDENYNRREATERLVQPDVCASAFVFYENLNAISTSQQENVAGDEETTPAAATRDHTPGRYFEEFSRWLMEDDEDEEPGEDKELLGPGRKRIEMAQLKSGWTLLLTSLILEIASAVFDQLGYALVGMVLAFVALLVATADLIHMAGKERMSLLPIFHRPSTTTFVPGKPVGTIVEYFGWVGAVWQCVYSTVAYAYARQKKDNPIKMSLLPLIFFSCVVISKLNERSSSTRVLRKGIFLTPKKPLYFG